MKLGVRPNPLRLKQDAPALCAWLGAHGFDSIDLQVPNAEAVDLCRTHGLEPGSFDLPGVPTISSPDSGKRRAAAAALREGLDGAAALGLTTWFVCFAPGDRTRSRAENFGFWADAFPAVAEHAASCSIRIAMEGWPGPGPQYPTLGCTPEMWRAMFAVAGMDALGLCFDPSHLVRLGIDYRRVLGEFGDRVHHVHGKDCALDHEQLYLQGCLPQTFGRPAFACSEGWWRYCVPGDGEVNWRDVVVALTACGYDGPISVELEDGLYMADEDGNRRGLVRARDHLRAAMG
jgi:sugar phosphate isomerase/epimerase